MGRCGGGLLEVIAAILQRPVIEEIVRNVGFDPQPKPKPKPKPMAGRAKQGARLGDQAASRVRQQGRIVTRCTAMLQQGGAARPVCATWSTLGETPRCKQGGWPKNAREPAESTFTPITSAQQGSHARPADPARSLRLVLPLAVKFLGSSLESKT